MASADAASYAMVECFKRRSASDEWVQAGVGTVAWTQPEPPSVYEQLLLVMDGEHEGGDPARRLAEVALPDPSTRFELLSDEQMITWSVGGSDTMTAVHFLSLEGCEQVWEDIQMVQSPAAAFLVPFVNCVVRPPGSSPSTLISV